MVVLSRLVQPGFFVLLVGLGRLSVAAAASEATLDERLASSLSVFLSGGQLPLALAVCGAAGLLTAFTPCVYPLVPITIRYFGTLESRHRRLALMYVSGMVLLYATLGTAFAASGRVFGSFLASPWVVGGLALMCIAMGLSMLGAFTLQLPPALNTRLTQVGGRTPAGAFTMGLVSGLVAAPCTGPTLLVVLAVIASSGNILLGFTLMVAFGVGLGLPFLALALFSGNLSKIPSGGPWMEAIKGVLATAMFVVAVYFARLAVPAFGDALQALEPISGSFWVAGTVTAGLVIGALSLESRVPALGKSVGVGLLTLGLSAGLLTETAAGIRWIERHDEGLRLAQTEARPVMIDFTAEWCQACKELDRKTYVDAAVQKEAQRFVNLKIDATTMDDEMNDLFEKYGVLGLPTVVFIDSEGKALDHPRVTGFVPPERFLTLMSTVR